MSAKRLSWSVLQEDHLERAVASFTCDWDDLDEELQLALEQAVYASTHYPGLVGLFEDHEPLAQWAEYIDSPAFVTAAGSLPLALTAAIATYEPGGDPVSAVLQLWRVGDADALRAAIAGPGRWVTFRVTLKDLPVLARCEYEDFMDGQQTSRSHGIDPATMSMSWTDVKRPELPADVRRRLMPDGADYMVDIDVVFWALPGKGQKPYADTIQVTLTARGV